MLQFLPTLEDASCLLVDREHLYFRRNYCYSSSLLFSEICNGAAINMSIVPTLVYVLWPQFIVVMRSSIASIVKESLVYFQVVSPATWSTKLLYFRDPYIFSGIISSLCAIPGYKLSLCQISYITVEPFWRDWVTNIQPSKLSHLYIHT